jgi:putative aldouronate transport system permease protein
VVEDDLSVRSPEEQELLREVSNRSFKAAQIFLAALPVLAIYPFLQRYFVKGTVLGGIKG